jgi:hypothetical protein
MSSDELVGVKSTIVLDNRQSMLYSGEGNEYLIKKSCQVVSPQIFQAQTVTNSQVSFQVQLPSKSVLCDTRAFVEVSAVVTFTAPAGAIAAGGTLIPKKPGDPFTPPFITYTNGPNVGGAYFDGIGFGSMRATPLSACTENLSVYINGVSISNTVNDYSQLYGLGLYTQDMNRLNYSGSFSYGDKSQQYNTESGQSLLSASCNPFSSLVNSDGSASYRGDMYYNILTNPIAVDGNATVATMQITWFEPILSAPFMFSGMRGDRRALGGINQLQLNWSLANITRMWSGIPNANFVLGVAVNIISANLHLTFISPSPILGPLPSALRYDCELFNNYKSPASQPVLANETMQLPSNNLQLNTIPSKCIIFCNKNWGSFAGQDVWKNTDALARIESVNIQFNNVTGILAAASEFQLYQMSVRNGLEMSWVDWQKHRGSILIIDFSKDIGTDSLSAVGCSGQYNFMCTVNIRNPNDFIDGTPLTYTYVLNVLFISDALMEVTPSYTRLANGFDRSVILRDINEGNIDLSSVDFAYAPNMIGSALGGAWWNNMSDFKSALVKGLNTVHKYLPQIEKAYDKYASPLLPGGVNTAFHGLAAVANKLIPLLVGQGMSAGKIHKMFHGHMPRHEVDALIAQASGGRMKKNRY